MNTTNIDPEGLSPDLDELYTIKKRYEYPDRTH
jgi:hypothetical protein